MGDPPARDRPIPTDAGVGVPDRGEAALAAADAEDLRERLAKADRRENRHALWLLVGMSPAALIPFIGLTLRGSLDLAVLLCVLVVLVEGFRWLLARREVTDLSMRLAVVEQRVAGAAGEPSNTAGGASP